MMNEETNYDRHERLMQPIRDAQTKTNLKITSIYFDNYIDEEENVDDKLTLNSDGFACLTEDIESLVDKYTGVKDSSFMKCSEIRGDLMDLIHSIINKEQD